MKKTKLTAFVLGALTLLAAGAAGCRVKEDGPKVTPETVKIAVAARGYGSAWEEAMCRAFTRETGIPAKVTYTTADMSLNFVDSCIRLGPSKNPYDIIVSINNTVFKHLSEGGGVVTGYNPVWADLSDVYDSPLDSAFAEAGEGVKIKDVIHPFYRDMATYSDDKQYMVPYALGTLSFLYNKGAFIDANKNLAEGAKLKLPRTTDEMFALFNDIKACRAAGKTDAYALAYSGSDDYSNYLYQPLWAQYDGMAAVRELLEGSYEGDYSQGWKGFGTAGRLEAMNVIRQMLMQSNGYTAPNDYSALFTEAQLRFLKGKSFFSFNGEWLERESSEEEGFNPGEADVALLRPPVISALGTKLGISEQQLIACIEYADQEDGYTLYTRERTETVAKPAVSESVLNAVTEARRVQLVDPNFLCQIPAYAKNKDNAKKFIKFMLSKAGCEILMGNAYGAMSPLRVDMQQFDYYKNEATGFTRSRFEAFKGSELFGEDFRTPIQYASGLKLNHFGGKSPGQYFGGSNVSTAAAVREAEVNYYKDGWENMLKDAGLK